MIQDEIGRAALGGNGLFRGVEGGRGRMIQDEIPPENAGRTGIVGEWAAKMIQDGDGHRAKWGLHFKAEAIP